MQVGVVLRVNKSSLLIFLCFFNVVSDSVFAYIEKDTRPLIYCPQQINCVVKNQLSSCKAEGDDLVYWSHIKSFNAKDTNYIGKYDLYSAKQSKPNGSGAICFYAYNETNLTDSAVNLYVTNEKGFFSEAAYDHQDSVWKRPDSDPNKFNNYFAICENSDPNRCPFRAARGIYLESEVDITTPPINGARIYANLKTYFVINKVPTYSYPGTHGQDNGLSPDNLEEFKQRCGSSQCDIYIQVSMIGGQDKKFYTAGYIEVDLNDNMKITGVYNNLTSPFAMRQKKPFNLVQFTKK